MTFYDGMVKVHSYSKIVIEAELIFKLARLILSKA